jgi:hypothetical protein
MASFRFIENCGEEVDQPRPGDDFEPDLPRPIHARPYNPDYIFNRDTIAQLRDSAASGAVLEEIARVAPVPARSPGAVSPLAVLGFLALAVYLSR